MTISLRMATLLALGAAVISGVNNFLTKIAVGSVGNPLAYTTLKNALVAALLLSIFFLRPSRKEALLLTKKNIFVLGAIGLVGGSIPFALYFTGLAQTSALNASLIHKTLFLWVALLAIPFLREKMSRWQWLGIGLVFASNLLVGGFVGFRYNQAELFILLATIMWAVENVVAKKGLQQMSSLLVATARMSLGSLVLFLLLALNGGLPSLASLRPEQWMWTLLTGVLLAGYVLAWYAALKRAPATYVATLLVPATLVTNILSAFFTTHSLSGWQISSGLVLTAGITLIIIFSRKFLRPATDVRWERKEEIG